MGQLCVEGQIARMLLMIHYDMSPLLIDAVAAMLHEIQACACPRTTS